MAENILMNGIIYNGVDSVSLINEDGKKVRYSPDEYYAPTLAQYVAENGAFAEETNVIYSFGAMVQVRLIEPWGLYSGVRVYNDSNPNNIDYNALEEHGAILFVDVTGAYPTTGMTAEELRTKPDALVYSSKNGDAHTLTNSGKVYSRICHIKGIYTRELNTNIHILHYVKDESGFHYGSVKVRNVYDLANTRKDSTSSAYTAEEKAVYKGMVELCDAQVAYYSK